MNARVVLLGTACALMTACGGKPPGHPQSPSAARSVPFEAEGKAIEASAGESSASGKSSPDIPGVYRLGSIKMMLTSYKSSGKKCSLEPAQHVVVSYTATTSFAPAQITEHGKFPRSLDGRTLSIRGKVFELPGSCLPVAEQVTDDAALASGGPAGPEELVVQDPPPRQRRPAEAKIGASGPQEPEKAVVGRRNAAESVPLPVERALPPLAPEVTTTFRPSLPDPPTG